MKKILSFIIIIILSLALFLIGACEKEPPEESVWGMAHLGEYPDWLETAPQHNLDALNTLDSTPMKAIYLFRQACYNQSYLTEYAYFLDGGGNSTFSSVDVVMDAQTVHIQNGNNSFHQMINLITEMNAGVLNDVITSFVSRSYQRIYYDGHRYYRKGTNSQYDENQVLIAAWEDFDISDQGAPSTREDYETEDAYLNAKYQTQTFLDFGLYTDGAETFNSSNLVLSEGTTIDALNDGNGHTYYKVVMAIDIAVANANEDTIAKLKDDTGTDSVTYSSFTLEFEVWQNGLFRSLNPTEGWQGNMKQGPFTLDGGSIASNPRTFSYHPDDCDLTDYVSILP
jgi:hypothetical protein